MGRVPPMGNGEDFIEREEGFKRRVTRQGEEAIGKLAQDVLENPVVTGALSRVFETRERAVRAQEVAMGALNLPSASDLERLTRRVRSVSQRLEGIEDGVDRLDDRLQRPPANSSLEDRLTSIERTLERLEAAQTAVAADAAKAAEVSRAPESSS
jgi:predicted  nucleic acid-binding Zn-ribbon protein